MDDDQQRLRAEYVRLDEALAALDDAIAARDEAKLRATATARAVGAQLNRLGHFARISGERFDKSVARRLYWEYPDVHVAEIAHPMGVREGSVSRDMGTGTFERPCQGECGATVTWTMRSRSDSTRQPRFCDACADEREKRHLEWRARYAAEESDNVALLRDAVERSNTPHARYAEFPGVPGTWAVDENGVPLALSRE